MFVFGHINAQTRTYNAARVEGEAPDIDGVLNEQTWNNAEWSGDFIQRDPYENDQPSQQTAIKILYDDQNLYVAVRAYDDEPEKIERRLARRDSWEGDWIAFAVDSYDDDLTAFSFGVNAAGVKNDGMATNDDNFDDTWNPAYYVKVSIDDQGYLAEFKIPYNQLRFADKTNHTWGLQVLRYIFRKEETSLWQIVPRESSRWVSLFGEIRNIRNIHPKKEIEIIPYAMGGLEKMEYEEGNPYATGTDWNYNMGLTGKVAVSNDFTLNYTINPDFGQVEADPSVVNLSAYENFFEEKRPFFIEGANIYDFPISSSPGGGPSGRDNLFYSRRIGRRPHYEPDIEDHQFIDMPAFSRILGAMKLSGKTKKGLSVGVLESLTNIEKAEIYDSGYTSKETVEPMTNFFNTRVMQDINKGNATVGGMFTATNRFINDSSVSYLPESAYTGGFDYIQFWNDKAYRFKAKMVFSYVSGTTEAMTELQKSPRRFFQRPDATHLEVDTTLTSLFGNGGSIEIAKVGKGNWRYGFLLNWRSPELELNDMGYLRTSDNIHQSAWLRYIIFEPFGIFRRVEIGVSQWSGWDYSATNKWGGIRLSAFSQLKNYFITEIGMNRSKEELEIAELRGGPAVIFPGSVGVWGFLKTDQRKKLVGEVKGSYRWGDFNWKRSWDVGFEISYQAFAGLQISVEPEYDQDYEYARYVETIELEDGNRYIMASLDRHNAMINIRINLSLTPDLSIQYWGQPFLFAGDYSIYKLVVDPTNPDYFNQFHDFTDDEISYDTESDVFNIDENGDGMIDYSFDNPDFSYYDFRSNFVVRWEYLPNSTVFFVWSQHRTGDDSYGEFDLNRQIDNLLNAGAFNVFLLKFSYRFSF